MYSWFPLSTGCNGKVVKMRVGKLRIVGRGVAMSVGWLNDFKNFRRVLF